MSSLLITLPVLISIVTAGLIYFAKSNKQIISGLSVFGALFNLCICSSLVVLVVNDGPQAVSFGNWMAPFGVVFAADLFGAFMVLITAIIGLAITIYAIPDLSEKSSYGTYHSLFHTLLGGVFGAFLTGDIFNLYVWFEVILISSFGLMILDANKKQIDGAVKYVVLNLIATLVFLLSIGLIYGATGTLNMADLHAKVAFLDFGTAQLIASLFLFAFAIKSALFPVFSWLPASYHTMPSAVVALFAALLTKVGVYALIRLFTLVFPLDQIGWQPLLIWIAGLTMLTGVLGATSQFTIKKILSFHIISQIGYMIMGLALYVPLALAGAIFYTIHHIIVKANLFLIGGILSRKHGTDNLDQLGGAYKATPWLSFLFLVPAFSLAGFPPLSGFWGKFLVIKSSLQTEYYLLAGTALFVGLLTIYSMTKIWSEAFWKPAAEKQLVEPLTKRELFFYYGPVIGLASLTIMIGFAVQPLFILAEQAADQLLYPDDYIQAVLGAKR